jgi:hypothetical protein
VFSLVGGLIVRLLTSDARGEERAAGMHWSWSSVSLANSIASVLASS